MATGFAAAVVADADGLAVDGAPAGAHAVATPTAASAWRNRLREIVVLVSRSICLPPERISRPTIRASPGVRATKRRHGGCAAERHVSRRERRDARAIRHRPRDRKSTRLNSSHLGISYAVFCLKKKKKNEKNGKTHWQYYSLDQHLNDTLQ